MSTHRRSHRGSHRGSRQYGMTLIEIVVATAIFGLIMAAAYQVLVSTLLAEAKLREFTAKGRIGESILGQMRRDLQGLVFRDFGDEVFLAEDGGDGDSAEDGVHFLTTAPVPPPIDNAEIWEEELAAVGVASVGYVIRQSRSNDVGNALFRRVKWSIEDGDRFDGETYFPIYDRIAGLQLRYLDREETWMEEWDSKLRYPEEEEEELIDAVDNPDGSGDGTANEFPVIDEEDEEEDVPEDLIVPRAVEITLWIYLSDEDGLRTLPNGEPIMERYSTVVPLLTSEVAELLSDEDLEDAEDP
ncbi:MAG: prepilin-type N-terminal cleavage/methylation domain-containing protein [Planctomycetota bacterium]